MSSASLAPVAPHPATVSTRRIRLRVATKIPQQAELWHATEPYLLYAGGRGAGKTQAGAIWSLSREARSVGLIVAPTVKNLLGGALATWLPIAYGAGLVVDYNKQEGWIKLIDGKLVYLRSLDRPELIRGLNINWFWGDELAVLKERTAWDILIACVRRPGERQRLVTTTFPKTGIRHWLPLLFIVKGIKGIHRVWRVKTSENPYLPDDFEADLRRQYADNFAAVELDAELLDLGAVEVYDVGKLLPGVLPPDIVRTVRAWDAATTGGGGDYTAGVLLSIADDGRLFVRDVVRGQWAPKERDEIMRRTAELDGPGVIIWVPTERTGAGRAQVDYWIRQLAGFTVVSGLERGDKVLRAGPIAGQVGAGNVSITSEPNRWETYFDEGRLLLPDAARAQLKANLSLFPHGRGKKDESDAFAMAYQTVIAKSEGLDPLIPQGWIERARREAKPDPPAPPGLLTPHELVEANAGLEIAGPGIGEDEHVLAIRVGDDLRELHSIPCGDDKPEAVGAARAECLRLLEPWRARLKRVCVNVVGLGDSFARDLEAAGLPVLEVNPSEKRSLTGDEHETFVNLRALLYWDLRARLENDRLGGLDDEIAATQLGEILWRPSPAGLVEIESREKTRERGGKPPARAEAIMLAYAEHDDPDDLGVS